MDLIDLEKKCQKIVELRTKRLALQTEINKNVAEVLEYMNSNNKKMLKVNKYSVEIVKRIRRKFDFDFLDKLQLQGFLPQTAMSKSEYFRLLIMSSENIKLVGNKFVIQ
jgi:hypothetical protein